MEDRKIESLRVKHHGIHRNAQPFIRHFPRYHRLRKLELEDVDIEYLNDPKVSLNL